MRAAAVKIDNYRQWLSGRRLRRDPDEIAATNLLMGNRELMVARRKCCGGRVAPRVSRPDERDQERERGSNHLMLAGFGQSRRRNVTV